MINFFQRKGFRKDWNLKKEYTRDVAKSIKINSTFVFSRLVDIIKDGSLIEKISYFTKGRN